ncbi:MAG: hypothetical protein ACMG6S_02550 [Byssovorax sp.]
MRTRGFSMIGVLAATLVPTSAFAVDPPKPPPAEAAVQAAPAKPAAAKPAPAAAKPPAAEPLPAPAVRLWMTASAPQGPWTMRIDNEGDKPLRIPADVRLLQFEIEPEPYIAPTEPADSKPKKWAKAKPPAKPTVCKIPAPLRPNGFPDKSALLLRPGESYVESFDPRLFCFGKDTAARLVGGAVVHTRFGWETPKKPAWSAKKKPDTGPFVVEGTTFPPEVMPLRELTAPTMVLRFSPAKPVARDADPTEDPTEPDANAADIKATDPKATDPNAADIKATDPKATDPKAADIKATDPKATDPKAADTKVAALPPIVDENAPRLELTSAPFVSASSTTRATITLTATNVGRRPMLVALHPRMLGFRIDGPDGVLRCSPMPPTHGIPRERFRALAPGASSAMTLLLGEGCTRDALRRPGLYRIQATLNAGESGEELGLAAYTGKVHMRQPTLIRVLDGPDPFYAERPRAVPTPKPPAPPEGDESDE